MKARPRRRDETILSFDVDCAMHTFPVAPGSALPTEPS